MLKLSPERRLDLTQVNRVELIENDVVIGYAEIKLEDDRLELRYIEILEDFRGQGYLRPFLRELFKFGHTIFGEVAGDETHLFEMWERLGADFISDFEFELR